MIVSTLKERNIKQTKMISIIFLVVLLIPFINLKAQQKQNKPGFLTLPNGWSLSPVGNQIALGDLPLNIALSADMHYAAVTNNGQSTQSIQLIDLRKQQLLDTYEIGKSWLGLTFGNDGKSLYASGGNDNFIVRLNVKNNKLICRDTFKLGVPLQDNISVAGIAVDESAHRIYAVTKDNNSLYVIDSGTKKILKQIPLGGEGYTCIVSPDKKHLYCSCWGCNKIVIINLKSLEIEEAIPVGDHPNDMVTDRKGKMLYVANSNDNSVSVINRSEEHTSELQSRQYLV